MTDVKLPGVGDKDPTRISKAIRDIAGPRNYLEYNSMATEPEAPREGVRIYFDDEEQAKAKSSSAVGMPFILPTWYTGNITVGPSDPWERIFKRHLGDGVITLEDGTYNASNLLTGSENGLLDVRGQTMGGATLIGNWSVNNRNVNLLYMDLLPEDNTTAMFVFTGGKLALSQTQTDISGYTNQKATVGQFVGGAHFHCTAGPAVLASAPGGAGRDCTFIVGGKITSQMFDLDSGCSIKFVGYEPTTLVKLSYTGTECAYALILDASGGLLTGTHLTGAGKTETTSNGIGLRRCSALTFANDIKIKDFYHGVRPIGGGHGYMLDGIFENCTYAVRKDSGYFEYVEADVTFTNVDFIARTDANVNAYAGGPPSYTQLNFNSGGATVAAGTTEYLGNGYSSATETEVRWRAPCDGWLRNLYPASTGSAGASKNFTYTVRLNGADTALVATTADSTITPDTTDSVAVDEGDYVTIKLVVDAAANARVHSINLLFVT